MAWADVADAVGNDNIDVSGIGMNALNAQRQYKKEAEQKAENDALYMVNIAKNMKSMTPAQRISLWPQIRARVSQSHPEIAKSLNETWDDNRDLNYLDTVIATESQMSEAPQGFEVGISQTGVPYRKDKQGNIWVNDESNNWVQAGVGANQPNQPYGATDEQYNALGTPPPDNSPQGNVMRQATGLGLLLKQFGIDPNVSSQIQDAFLGNQIPDGAVFDNTQPTNSLVAPGKSVNSLLAPKPSPSLLYQQERDKTQDARQSQKDAEDARQRDFTNNRGIEADKRSQTALNNSTEANKLAQEAKEKALKNPTFTADETNAYKFYKLMNESKKVLDSVSFDPTSAKGALEATLAGSPLRSVSSPDAQRYYAAASNWVKANLRKESGAAIPASELAQEIDRYFPKYGESQKVVEDKKRYRQQAEEAMREAGYKVLNFEQSKQQQGNQIYQPKTEQDFARIPSGALFIDPDDGKQYRKP